MNALITRFAPSPTGFLHLGGIRTALINYILTKQAKISNPESKFFLRIEDTDKERSEDKYRESILNGLNWMGIKWEGEIIIQSNRLKRHKEVAYELLNIGKAFKCICTIEELELKRKKNKEKNLNVKRLCDKCEDDAKIQNLDQDYCIRLKIPKEGKIIINDKLQGEVNIDNNQIDNFILLRKNHTPTYMLSVVVDDNDMGINYIIRGDDHFNNAFRQIYIYKHMNWSIPNYAHIPLIHGEDGTKLSKRHGAIDINNLKDIGYLPQAILNNLILLGWSPKKKEEAIEIDEIISDFKIENMSKSSSIFSFDKLNYFNNYYLTKKENYEQYKKFINENILLNNFKLDDEVISKIFETYKNKIEYYSKFKEIFSIYLENFETEKNDILDDEFDLLLNKFTKSLSDIKEWNLINLENSISLFLKTENIKFKVFGKPLRFMLTNTTDGPSISYILNILGKKNTFLRVNNYINSKN